MSKRRVIISALLLIIVGVLWVFLKGGKSGEANNNQTNFKTDRPDPNGLNPANIEGEPKMDLMERMAQKLKDTNVNAPIDFWGKVQDTEGNSIAGAEVKVSISKFSSWYEDVSTRSRFTVLSDTEGKFQVLGKNGYSIRLNVEKDGYAPHHSPEKRRNHASEDLTYFGEDQNLPNKRPTSRQPIVFILRKKNPIANLSHAVKKDTPIVTDGTPRQIELKLDQQSSVILEVQCWSSCPVPFTYNKYDWNAEIKVIGAQLQPITNNHAVTAPTQGYESIFRVEMPSDVTSYTWKAANIQQRNFWLKFENGSYAKAKIEVNTGRKHEVDADIWYNLDGTNNFEQ